MKKVNQLLVQISSSLSRPFNVWFQKISIPPPQRVIGHSEGDWRGVLKAKIFKGMYEPKLEFSEGWGVQIEKKPLWREYGYFLEQHND